MVGERFFVININKSSLGNKTRECERHTSISFISAMDDMMKGLFNKDKHLNQKRGDAIRKGVCRVYHSINRI